MAKYVVRRLVYSIPVLVLVSMVVFSLLHIVPGDPVALLVTEQTDKQTVAAIRHDLRLDRPIFEQYALWLGDALRGDLGRSIRTHQPVAEELVRRIPVTLHLTLFGLLLTLLISFPVGIVSALHPNGMIDYLLMGFTMLGVGIASFWLGIMLILLFSVGLHWMPASGYIGFFEDPLQSVRSTIMPAFALSLGLGASVARLTRSSMLEVLGEQYIITARSGGIFELRVTWVHALKNALVPVVTVLGVQVGRLLGGAVLIEIIFSIPGIGRLAVDSIFTHDFPMVQGVVLVMGVFVLLCNLIVDVLYAYIDPRIRYT